MLKKIHFLIGFMTYAGLLLSQNDSLLIKKKAFDFNNVRVRTLGSTVLLEDTVSGKMPIKLAPNATFEKCLELDKKNHYAIVFCINRYFIINKYGDVSFGTEKYPEFYDPKTDNIYAKHLKSSKGPGLYNFNGKELGKLSKYPTSYQEFDMTSGDCYYLIIDSKKKKGLMRDNGELILKCEYLDIGTINNGKCEIWIKKGEEPVVVDLKAIKALEWPK